MTFEKVTCKIHALTLTPAIVVKPIDLPSIKLIIEQSYGNIPSFLKRVKKENDDIWVIVSLNKDVDLNRFDGLVKESKIVEVPSEPCPCIELLPIFKSYWPISFHKTKIPLKMEKMSIWPIDPDYKDFPEEFRLRIESMMEQLEPNECIIFKKNKVIYGRKESHPLHHPVFMAIRNLSETYDSSYKSMREDPFDISEDYLATGFTCIVEEEPCLFCSMALLHSRVKYVFFKKRNQLHGGLGSIAFIHEHRALNHHFGVYMKKKHD